MGVGVEGFENVSRRKRKKFIVEEWEVICLVPSMLVSVCKPENG